MDEAPQLPGVPRLTGVVVHWHNPRQLEALLAAWPEDPRFELVVVNNGGAEGVGEGRPGVRLLEPGRNLGFGGGANRGVAKARGEIVLLLNPDARPEPGAPEALLDGFRRHPEAAGLAPRLAGEDGAPQHAWQLRRLPGPGTLLLQTLLIPAGGGAREEPAPGAPVEQPAAAALALRKEVLEAHGGFDEGYFPAWFEDVDLARRLARGGHRLLYWPEAAFTHGLGASVPRLGYGTFLWVYNRNLVRYLAKHHGRAWALAASALLPLGMGLRLLALPLRRPRRAESRGAAARGLLAAATGALSGFRRPTRLAREHGAGWRLRV